MESLKKFVGKHKDRLATLGVGVGIIVIIWIAYFYSASSDVSPGTVKAYRPGTSASASGGEGSLDGTFEVYANTNLTIEDGKMNLMGQNISTNSDDCYIEVVLKDSEKVIYKSDILSPGYSIEEASVNTSMSAGEHPGKVIFNVLDESGDVKNTVRLNAKITVKE